jgi:uncharacterized protein (DUF1499 family)
MLVHARARGAVALLCALLAVARGGGVAAAPLSPSCVSSASVGTDYFPDKLSFSSNPAQARAAAKGGARAAPRADARSRSGCGSRR